MSQVTDAAEFVSLAANEISDGDVCFVGIGVPSLAAIVAKRHHAPNAVLIYESGAIDADPPIPPLSTGSPSVVENTSMITSCLGVFSMLQQGVFDLGLLSAAQVDRYGNLNSTELKRTGKPPLRLVGSGGANDIMALVKATIIIMPHDRRRFVERVDFVTSPGLRNQPGMFIMPPRGNGTTVLVTPRARFTFEAGELTLDAIAHGFSQDEALEIIPWDVPHAANIRQLPPTQKQTAATAQQLLDDWGRDAT